MMDNLLRQNESKTLDFKRDLSSPRGVLKTLVAFANSAGGRVVLGVDDDKQVLGVADPLAAEERIRNPVIARVFRELQLVEQWGSGVKRIFDEARQQGLPEPGITEIATGLRFTVWLKETVSVNAASDLSQQARTEQVPDKYRTSTGQVAKLLSLMRDRELGVRDIMREVGLKHRETFLKNYLYPALEAGLVEMTQPDSPRSPTQKYRLTAKGQAAGASNTRK